MAQCLDGLTDAGTNSKMADRAFWTRLPSRRGILVIAGLLAAHAFARAQAGMIPRVWLEEKITIAEAEARFSVTMPSGQKMPFGYENARWEALKSNVRPGDELWTFASPPESWANLAGRAGIALVRGNAVIDTLVTKMN